MKLDYFSVFFQFQGKKVEEKVNLIVCYNEEKNRYYFYVTNMDVCSVQDCIEIVISYLSRWSVEEHWKVWKEMFDIEKVQFMTLNVINKVFHLLTVITEKAKSLIKSEEFESWIKKNWKTLRRVDSEMAINWSRPIFEILKEQVKLSKNLKKVKKNRGNKNLSPPSSQRKKSFITKIKDFLFLLF